MTSVATGGTTARPGQYLTFSLAGEEYGIAILRVREIVECGAVTRVPGTPPFIRGVVNLRGTVLPVVDLAAKFGLGETALSRWTCVVMVEAEWEGVTTAMGLMTDAVSRVLDLGPQDIEPVPSFGVPVRLDYLLGMGRAEPRLVLILDIDRVLSPEELMALPGEGSDRLVQEGLERGAVRRGERATVPAEEHR
jgi:purine-binding chemotaxis protein CheW